MEESEQIQQIDLTNEEYSYRSPGFWAAFGSLCAATFASALDSCIVGVAIPTISQEFGSTSNEGFWIGTSFLLSSVVFQPIFGSLSEIFGRKIFLLFSIFTFFFASILCATAKNATWLIGARTAQGVGGSGIIVLSEIIVQDIVPMRDRGIYNGIMGLVWALGTVVAPIIGGAFTTNVSWRWCFWINLPICAIAFVLCIFFLHLHLDHENTKTRLSRVDYGGIVLFSMSIVSFLIGLTWGGTMYAWNSPNVLVPLILGVFGVGALVFYEIHVPTEPMIPFRMFKNRTTSAGFYITFAHGAVLWCLIYYWPIYFQGALGHSALLSGVDCLPMTLTVAPFAALGGIICATTKRYLRLGQISVVVMTVGVGVATIIQYDSNTAKRVGILIPGGIGAGLIFSTIMFGVQSAQEDKFVAIATSTAVFFRSFGQVFGVAIGGVIFSNEWKKQMIKFGSQIPEQFMVSANDAAGFASRVNELPLSLFPYFAMSFTNCLRVILYFCTALCGSMVLIVVFMKNYSLDRGFTSNQRYQNKNEQIEEGKKGIDGFQIGAELDI